MINENTKHMMPNSLKYSAIFYKILNYHLYQMLLNKLQFLYLLNVTHFFKEVTIFY